MVTRYLGIEYTCMLVRREHHLLCSAWGRCPHAVQTMLFVNQSERDREPLMSCDTKNLLVVLQYRIAITVESNRI